MGISCYPSKELFRSMLALDGACCASDLLGFHSKDDPFPILEPDRIILVGYAENPLL